MAYYIHEIASCQKELISIPMIKSVYEVNSHFLIIEWMDSRHNNILPF
jgi:hypothetical protein